MRIKNIRTAKNVVACFVGINLLMAQMAIPPFKREEEYTLNSYEDNMEYSRTRTLKKKNNASNNDRSYHRNARNSLRKSNYYGKNEDF